MLCRLNTDWDAYERSWDFQSLPLLTASSEPTPTLESSYTAWITQNRDTIAEMKRLEEENNRLFIDAYGLADELTPDVPIEQITLTVNPAYRYGGKLTEEEQWTRFRQDTMEELVSYAIGCMMGRYSLDEPGLIYAHSGNEGFDPSRYTTFPADDDGIIPLTDTDWFDDDAAHRFDQVHLGGLGRGPPRREPHLPGRQPLAEEGRVDPRDDPPLPLRQLLQDTPADLQEAAHLLALLQRQAEGLPVPGLPAPLQRGHALADAHASTSSRCRARWPPASSSSRATSRPRHPRAQSKRLEKEQDKLEKQQVELQAFDEKLRHYADRRITLDLDDGVKVNYGKFGDLLAEVKAVHGKKAEE